MPLTQIVLRLARNPGYPDGDDRESYVVTAPLDAQGRLDPEAWKSVKAACKVVRFKRDEERHADGFLSHRGVNWFIHYDEREEGDDEPVYRLGEHRLAVGEYVTIHENDGRSLTFRVAQHLPISKAEEPRTTAPKKTTSAHHGPGKEAAK